VWQPIKERQRGMLNSTSPEGRSSNNQPNASPNKATPSIRRGKHTDDATAPASICLLRLSAIGDVCHALPVVRTLQKHWPQTQISWIIGKTEYQLIGDIPDIEFIVFDKSKKFRAYQSLRQTLKHRRFDVLLHMQTSLRSNIASLCIPAKQKIGFDRARAKELQWLFTHQKIAPPAQGEHQIDVFFSFIESLGIQAKTLSWNIPIPQEAVAFAHRACSPTQPTLVINACSSPSKRVQRNWHAEGYAQVIDYAAHTLNYHVILCGGPTAFEQQMGEQIGHLCQSKPVNLIGKTSLKQLLALLDHADILITSDSGPAHIATAVGTPVIGLYAVTNPFQTGPYLSYPWLINKYPEAIQQEYNQHLEKLPWGIRVHSEQAMRQITSAEVTAMLSRFTHQLVKN